MQKSCPFCDQRGQTLDGGTSGERINCAGHLQLVLTARIKANMESYLATSQAESRAVEEYTAQTPPPSGNGPNVKLTLASERFQC